MRYNRIIFAAAFFCLLFSAFAASAEYIFLNDGSILKCSIESETAGVISIRLLNGKTMTVNPKSVMRILYTDLYMGRIHVQKVDGSTFEGYIVDEDQSTVTFRKDISRPYEFIVRREDILFITRKNPVGLEGTSESDRLSLKWTPPYTSVKGYNIYLKSGKEYKLAGKSGSASFIVKGLKSNTLYSVKVTATDSDGIETLPTNEIKIKTKNIRPEPPAKVKCAKKKVKDKQDIILVSWSNGFSTDWKIKGYRVLEKDGVTFKDVMFTKKNELEIKNTDKGRNYFFTIRSVDENGWESENSMVVNTLPLGVDFSVEGSLIAPFGRFRDVHSFGYGMLLRAVKPDFPFNNIETGAAAGYWNFSGVNNVKSSFMVPAFISIGYRIDLLRFVITPRICGGVSYNRVGYNAYMGVGIPKEKKTISGVEPLAIAGMSAQCVISNRFSLFAGADVGSILEKNNFYPFVSFNSGVIVKF